MIIKKKHRFPRYVINVTKSMSNERNVFLSIPLICYMATKRRCTTRNYNSQEINELANKKEKKILKIYMYVYTRININPLSLLTKIAYNTGRTFIIFVSLNNISRHLKVLTLPFNTLYNL